MPSELTTVIDLVTGREFIAGIAIGAVALVAVIAVPSRLRTHWGLLLAASTMVGINVAFEQRLVLSFGVTLLAIGGWVADRYKTTPVLSYVGWVIVALGAIAIPRGTPKLESVWIEVGVPLAVVGLGWALKGWQALPQSNLLGLLVFITAGGIWATVPDTDAARVFLGASIPLAIATIEPLRSRISFSGALALSGVIVSIVVSGGAERPASIAGGLACAGILVMLPAMGARTQGLGRTVVIASHVVVVLIASRMFGLWERTIPAVVGLALLGMVAYAVLTWLTNRATP
ncbi:MAG: hypothetical protein WBM90_04480, partial [Acidimicrobiia bacterium]